RKRLKAVEQNATVGNLHGLRKRVKDLWYQLRLIREADRPLIGSLADLAHDLSDHLGDDHDLALLREEASRRHGAFEDPADRRPRCASTAGRRGELKSAATSLAARVYNRKPKKFTSRLRRRWEAWREREPVG